MQPRQGMPESFRDYLRQRWEAGLPRATQSGGGGADATWFRLGEPQRSRSRPES